MKNKDLIIQLIQEDMRHNQLVLNLDRIGLHSGGNYDLSLFEVIANLNGHCTRLNQRPIWKRL